ncbi:cell division protein FtsA [Lentisphaerota bacterium WC36G]|nr:cell division protein FtsA [Lentisphaerae bacterium WC36]
MFKRKKIVTCVEMGTSQTIALIASCSGDDEKFDILGYSIVDTNQAVIKGEIADSNKALQLIEQVLKEAVRNAQTAIDPSYLFLNISACEIASEKSSAHAIIKGDNHIVTEKDVNDAILIARESNSKLLTAKVSLQVFENFFMIDDRNHVKDPIGEVAHKLTAVICNILGNETKIEPFLKIFQSLDFDNNCLMLFSGISSSWGVLPEISDDKENGVVVIDYGAGTVEYTVFYKGMVIYSKALSVGIDHIINDVKIAFDLSFSVAKEIVDNGKYLEMLKRGEVFYEVHSKEQKAKRIQLEELAKVINLRVHETFHIINDELLSLNIKGVLDNGVVLTGGGALQPTVENGCREVLDLPQRIGRPLNRNNIPDELYSPRNSSILGLLNLICANHKHFLEQERQNILIRVIHGVDYVAKSMFEGFKEKLKAFKI